jgi:sulfotransferase
VKLKRVHFISGLPRSGSTLLAALLRQNPGLQASMTSPVASLFGSVHQKMSGGEFGVFFDDGRRKAVFEAIFDAYYGGRQGDGAIFDTNRSWTGKMALLLSIFPDAKVICCVREIGWIIDSIERMLNKNPLQISRVFKFKASDSIYARTEILMNSTDGLVGQPWSTLREAWFGEFSKRLIVVPYNVLASKPGETMARLYAELGLAPFRHDFENVVYDEPDYDLNLGMPGLHKVQSKVELRQREPCIPPDIFSKYVSAGFWEHPELNLGKVKVF